MESVDIDVLGVGFIRRSGDIAGPQQGVNVLGLASVDEPKQVANLGGVGVGSLDSILLVCSPDQHQRKRRQDGRVGKPFRGGGEKGSARHSQIPDDAVLESLREHRSRPAGGVMSRRRLPLHQYDAPVFG